MILLMRYDTETSWDGFDNRGFLEKAVEVHRKYEIPATYFCTGKALDTAPEAFRDFCLEVKDDALFDLQDHSYSHIGVGYEESAELDVLKADYEQSFAAHERIFEKRPTGISICGVGDAGKRLDGFDQTEKAKLELKMLSDLGVTMINTFLAGKRPGNDFINYSSVGLPNMMGFPSNHCDVNWMVKPVSGDPVTDVINGLEKDAAEGLHSSVVMHDWCAYDKAPDKELTHVIEIAEGARKLGYELRTHVGCYQDRPLWQ